MALEVTVWSAHSSDVGFNRTSGDDSVDIRSCTVSCFALLAVFGEESVVAQRWAFGIDARMGMTWYGF